MRKKITSVPGNQAEEELRHVLYVVSHDLGKYIRHMHEFTKILLTESKEKFNKEELEYASMLLRASGSAEKMIKSLLEYSRIETHAEPFRVINTSRLVHTVIQGLEEKIQESGAVINLPPLPFVFADEKQMLLLWQHVLSNALTFVDGGTKPVINVSVKKMRKMFVFSVKDNGIGIPEDSYERIFKLFSRLHLEDKYPGIGAGLAIVKRILKRHGGEIWLTSDSKKGTEFHFSLPQPA